MHDIKGNAEAEKEDHVTIDTATADGIALQRVGHRLRIVTMTVLTAAEVRVTSQNVNLDTTDGVPAVIRKADEMCKRGGSNSREKTKKGQKNS